MCVFVCLSVNNASKLCVQKVITRLCACIYSHAKLKLFQLDKNWSYFYSLFLPVSLINGFCQILFNASGDILPLVVVFIAFFSSFLLSTVMFFQMKKSSSDLLSFLSFESFPQTRGEVNSVHFTLDQIDFSVLLMVKVSVIVFVKIVAGITRCSKRGTNNTLEQVVTSYNSIILFLD